MVKQVNIGKIIEEKFNASGLTKRAFAEKIGISQRHLYTLFEKNSVDTAQLQRICEILHFDFFTAFTEYRIPKPKAMISEEPSENYPAKVNFKLEINISGKLNKTEILEAVVEELNRRF